MQLGLSWGVVINDNGNSHINLLQLLVTAHIILWAPSLPDGPLELRAPCDVPLSTLTRLLGPRVKDRSHPPWAVLGRAEVSSSLQSSSQNPGQAGWQTGPWAVSLGCWPPPFWLALGWLHEESQAPTLKGGKVRSSSLQSSSWWQP